jgi:hypothetical protein
MSDFNRGYARPAPASADMSVDAGLRSFMLGVYNKLALGLLLSAALAYLTVNVAPVRDMLYVISPDGRLVGMTLLGQIARFAPLVAMIVAMFAMRNPSPRSSGALYWFIVSSIGVGAGVWLLIYTGASVASTFLITAVAFGSLSLVGYTTKRDLTGMGSFLFMGLIGIIIASVVNIFLGSTALQFAISVIGVLVFTGLAAYDTQKFKTMYSVNDDGTVSGRKAVLGALSLYLDFINLFLMLLRLFGSNRN